MAQTLARHNDIRLTLGTYTHIERHAQTAAIESLPGPPGVAKDEAAGEAGRREWLCQELRRGRLLGVLNDETAISECLGSEPAIPPRGNQPFWKRIGF